MTNLSSNNLNKLRSEYRATVLVYVSKLESISVFYISYPTDVLSVHVFAVFSIA